MDRLNIFITFISFWMLPAVLAVAMDKIKRGIKI